MVFLMSRLSIATEALGKFMTIAASENGLRATRPGKILREDYLKPLGIIANLGSVTQAVGIMGDRHRAGAMWHGSGHCHEIGVLLWW